MRIESNRQAGTVASRSGAGRSGTNQVFTPYDPAGAVAAARPAMAASSLTGLEAILALQGVGDSLEGRRRAIRRGRDLLDGLDALKAELLAGRVDVQRLESLGRSLGEDVPADQPELAAVLAEIELRVAVELAKLGR